MSKRFRIITKLISLILVVVMITEILPLSALATESENTDAANYNDVVDFYYNYHNINVGRAGTLGINDYTLTPSLDFDLPFINGSVMPVTISMQYNSSALDIFYGIEECEQVCLKKFYSTGQLMVYLEALCFIF